MQAPPPPPAAAGSPADPRNLYCLLVTVLISLLFILAFSLSSSSTTSSSTPSSLCSAAAASALLSLSSAPSPPSLAYLLSGSDGDADRLLRLLHAAYHPNNFYLLHLDLSAPQPQRDRLALAVRDVPAFRSAGNVHVVGRPDAANARGSSALAATLHGAAILLRLAPRWDWFLNLDASDYPIATQDDLLHVLSFLPTDLNFVQHSSRIGWRETRQLRPIIVDPGLYQSSQVDIFYATQRRELPNAYRLFRDLLHVLSFLPTDLNFVQHSSRIGWRETRQLRPIIVDPGLYQSSQVDIFYATQRRELPNAYRLFRGSGSVILSRKFTEYCILGTDNLPRTTLMYYSNTLSPHTKYFQTVLCNSPEFNKTIVNNDLHYVSWDAPPKKDSRVLGLDDFKNMTRSGSAFATRFAKDDLVLGRIDKEILGRGPSRITPGGWCLGGGDDPCTTWGNANVLKPGPASRKLAKLITELLSNGTFRFHQCVWDYSM